MTKTQPFIPVRMAPLHMAAGILLVLWNSFGLALALRLQFGGAAPINSTTAEYFDSQSLAFVLVADLGPLAGIAGSLALLLQHRAAVALFVAQFVIIALANGYELLAGTSILLMEGASFGPTLFAFALFAAQIAYARWLAARGMLH